MSIRWGIIGCGDVCEVKSGPGFQQAEGSQLVAVMRRNGRLAEDFARRHAVPAFYDEARKLIEDPRVDAVYVATPPGSHLELALDVARAGKPAYVEKPMARCYAECEQMLEAFDKASLPLFVAYYRRALPRFVKARDLIQSGTLGTITGASCRFASPAHRTCDPANLPWRLQAEHSGGGLFLDLASHSLDLLDFFAGPLEDVDGRAANLATPCEVEDRVVLHYGTASGALGTGSWNFASEAAEDVIVVSGTDGEVRLSTFGAEPVELHTAQGVECFDLPNPPHIQQPLIQTVVDSLLGRGDCPSTGASAARTSQVMDRALVGYYGSREPGFWEPRDRRSVIGDRRLNR
jgi:predicted dehydrogenase